MLCTVVCVLVNEVTNPTTSIGDRSGWTAIINESVHTSDEQDIGDVEAVNRDFIVVKRGFVNIHRYYIPISKVQGWDGNVIWLSIPEERVISDYERDTTIPDPSIYYVKGEEDKFAGTHWKEFPRIKPRYVPPQYVITSKKAKQEEHIVYTCVLCGATFRTDEDFSRHVAAH